MSKKARLAARVLAVLAAAGPPGFRGEAAETELSARLEIPGAQACRITAEAGAARLLFVSVRDIRRPEDDYAAVGFGAPFLVLGPVDPGGLFREIGNPLGYDAGSSVFEEATVLSLRTAMEKSSRFGVWASAPGGRFGVGGYSAGADDFHAAAGIGGPRLSALAMASSPDSGRTPAEWFPEKPVYPGGSLFHLAGSARAPLGALTGAETFLGISFGVSRGARTPAGGFAHVCGSHRSPAVEADFMTGSCGADYVTPAGSFPSDRTAAAARLRLFPEGVFSVRGMVRAEEGRAESLPFRRPAVRREAGGGADFTGKKFKVTVEGGGTRETSSAGRTSRLSTARAAAAYRGKNTSLDGSFRAEWENGGFAGGRLACEAEVRPRGWEFGMQAAGEWKPGPELSCGVRGALVRRGMRIEAEARLGGLPARAGGFRALLEEPLRFVVFSVSWRVRG